LIYVPKRLIRSLADRKKNFSSQEGNIAAKSDLRNCGRCAIKRMPVDRGGGFLDIIIAENV
jgi:hypothetical protein